MTMRVQINHVDQFYELAQPARARLKADSGEPLELEIVLMPGDYKGTNLTLGSSLDDHLVQVVMRGSDLADPARLSDLSLHLKGITLRLENLVFLDTTSDAALLNVHATEEIIISNCAFIGNSSVSKPGGNYWKYRRVVRQPAPKFGIAGLSATRRATKTHYWLSIAYCRGVLRMLASKMWLFSIITLLLLLHPMLRKPLILQTACIAHPWNDCRLFSLPSIRRIPH